MFGFSITKLLFTGIAVFLIWNGFKWYTRMQENRDLGTRKRPAAQAASNRTAQVDAEEMIKCPVCETYVSSTSAVSCGKSGCPYPG